MIFFPWHALHKQLGFSSEMSKKTDIFLFFYLYLWACDGAYLRGSSCKQMMDRVDVAHIVLPGDE